MLTDHGDTARDAATGNDVGQFHRVISNERSQSSTGPEQIPLKRPSRRLSRRRISRKLLPADPVEQCCKRLSTVQNLAHPLEAGLRNAIAFLGVLQLVAHQGK